MLFPVVGCREEEEEGGGDMRVCLVHGNTSVSSTLGKEKGTNGEGPNVACRPPDGSPGALFLKSQQAPLIRLQHLNKTK